MITWAGVAVAVAIVAALAVTNLRRAEPPAPAAQTGNGPTATQVASAPEPPARAAQSDETAADASARGTRPVAPHATVKSAEAGSTPASSTPGAARDRTASAPESSSAKQLYAAPADGESVNPGLKYRLIEQRGSTEADADPSRVFHSRERVRFAFESNIDGYLYVVAAGSSGQWTVLFPNPEANGGKNAIVRSEAYLVPDNGWFEFDETPGTEEIFVVLSKRALDTLPGFKAPVTRRETVDRSIVTGLQASLQSRDMVFQKDQSVAADGKTRQTTYIVNRGELASQVAALIPLAHAK